MPIPDPSEPIDLRSDTVTKPTPAMRRAMAEAPVGDVCYGDDPTVRRLEAVAAERLGKEAAIYLPSGTMANQIAITLHTRPGDAVFCERRAHIANWEVGGPAANAGVQLVPLDGEGGLPAVADLDAALFPDSVRAAPNRLLALENTHNAAGGIPHGATALAERTDWARSRGLAAHLDGARLFNAAAATGEAPERLAGGFDTVSFCLSKGLGAPVGSLLTGSRHHVEAADRIRHRMGGGWRQAGILAAAGLHALEHHVTRLADDHARAARIAEMLAKSGIGRPLHPVKTNILYFEVEASRGTAPALTAAMAERGILFDAYAARRARIVTHLGVGDEALRRFEVALSELPHVF